MLAPFTAGWHSTDLEPLVIQKSEVRIVSFSVCLLEKLLNSVFNVCYAIYHRVRMSMMLTGRSTSML